MTPELFAKAVILGLVEGVTEFIPVSSTGHLIVVSEWLGQVDERAKTFDIFIQLGAILAIVWLYRARLLHAAAARQARSGEPAVLPQPRDRLPARGGDRLPDPRLDQGAALQHPGSGRGAGASAASPSCSSSAGGRGPGTRRSPTSPRRTALGIGLAQVLSLVPGHLAIGGHDHGRVRARAVADGGHRVLLLPRHPGHVRGHALRSDEERRRPLGGGRCRSSPPGSWSRSSPRWSW